MMEFQFDPFIEKCPLCANSSIKHLYTIYRIQPNFSVYRCSACAFIFMNPPLSENSERQLYSEGYYTGTADYSYYDERTVEKYAEYVWKARINTIRKYIKSGNFLDIGCSFGGFLNTASHFFNVYGIEPSEYSGKYAQQRFGKERIHIGTVFDHPFPESYFSIITMIEVLEHIRNPYQALETCYKLLAPRGLIVIQTANMAGLQAKLLKHRYGYFLPGHFSYFTKKNLTQTLKNIGFTKIKVFQPVDFGLLPKLLKSRMIFSSIIDYRKWLRIAFYHWISKIHVGNFAMTSSMVVYAFK